VRTRDRLSTPLLLVIEAFLKRTAVIDYHQIFAKFFLRTPQHYGSSRDIYGIS